MSVWTRFVSWFFWLGSPRGLRPQNWLFARFLRKGLLRPIARLRIFTVDVDGKENLRSKGNMIVAGNHPSLWDGLVCAGALDRIVIFFAKAELWRNKLFGLFMSLMGQIPVDRGNREAGAKAQATGLRVLNRRSKHGRNKGGVVAIYPEGKCTDPENTAAGVMNATLKAGVYYLAKGSGAPVIPMATYGSQNIPKARYWHLIRRSKRVSVKLRFGKALDVKDFDNVDDFLAALRASVEHMLADLRAGK